MSMALESETCRFLSGPQPDVEWGTLPACGTEHPATARLDWYIFLRLGWSSPKPLVKWLPLELSNRKDTLFTAHRCRYARFLEEIDLTESEANNVGISLKVPGVDEFLSAATYED